MYANSQVRIKKASAMLIFTHSTLSLVSQALDSNTPIQPLQGAIVQADITEKPAEAWSDINSKIFSE